MAISETVNIFLTVYKEFKDNTQKFLLFVLVGCLIACFYIIYEQAEELNASQQERIDDLRLMSWKIDSLSSIKINQISIQKKKKR
mgnify:FL=1